MPRIIADYAEQQRILPRYKEALEIAKTSDCAEAKFGVVIFAGGRVLATGRNYVPTHLAPLRCESDCPRRTIGGLSGGVGAEICFAVHAEQDAVNMLNKLRNEPRRGIEAISSLVVARMKEGEEVVPEAVMPRCTECAKRIAVETSIREVVLAVKSPGGTGFVAFGREEFYRESISGLTSNWGDFLRNLRK